ncbi:MAG: FeoC-like transcriptional regulator [Zavarzinia sp.]|nr:FeoC-like transcriptional regulator [Zavarzinia sp.]
MTTLSDVRRYMRDHGRVTAPALAIGLGTTADNARALLEFWRDRRRVRVVEAPCGHCRTAACACGSAVVMPEVYEWIEA